MKKYILKKGEKMKCSICKRDLGKGYNGRIYKVNNMFFCEKCHDYFMKTGMFKNIYNNFNEKIYIKKVRK